MTPTPAEQRLLIATDSVKSITGLQKLYYQCLQANLKEFATSFGNIFDVYHKLVTAPPSPNTTETFQDALAQRK